MYRLDVLLSQFGTSLLFHVQLSAFPELGPQINWAFINWASEPQTQTVASDMGNILGEFQGQQQGGGLDKKQGQVGKEWETEQMDFCVST